MMKNRYFLYDNLNTTCRIPREYPRKIHRNSEEDVNEPARPANLRNAQRTYSATIHLANICNTSTGFASVWIWGWWWNVAFGNYRNQDYHHIGSRSGSVYTRGSMQSFGRIRFINIIRFCLEHHHQTQQIPPFLRIWLCPDSGPGMMMNTLHYTFWFSTVQTMFCIWILE